LSGDHLHINDPEAKQLFDRQTGRGKAFADVYQKHFALVYHYAKKILDDAGEAEDIASESFVKLWEQFSVFDDEAAMRSYLITVTRNACLNRIKLNKRARDREALFASSDQADDNAVTREEVTGRIYQYIYDEIEKLPAQEKKVFKMSYLEGKSNEMIATLLQINNQSVRNHKARALKALRKVLHQKDIWPVFLVLIGLVKE